MPNMMPEQLGTFWHGRWGVVEGDIGVPGTTAFWVHPDEHVEKELPLSRQQDDPWPEAWWELLVVQVEGPRGGLQVGEVRVEEDVVRCYHRVVGTRWDGRRREERQWYGVPLVDPRGLNEAGLRARQEKRAELLAASRRESFAKAVEFARHMARSMRAGEGSGHERAGDGAVGEALVAGERAPGAG